ncbi:flagellar hook-basal body complex protein, partial [Paraburkholderia phenazinium]|uniref:flagellar hook-basal body complex protein n=1 Tax=Paraburkholderia phenazinium TaxID=60549 RepID=UPI00158E584D
VLDSTPGADYTPGPITRTGNPLDVAVQGPGWLSVLAPDGSEAYTRAGNLHVDENGQLVNASNLPVVGGGGPIAIPPNAKVTIGPDGTVSVLAAARAFQLHTKLISTADQNEQTANQILSFS